MLHRGERPAVDQPGRGGDRGPAEQTQGPPPLPAERRLQGCERHHLGAYAGQSGSVAGHEGLVHREAVPEKLAGQQTPFRRDRAHGLSGVGHHEPRDPLGDVDAVARREHEREVPILGDVEPRIFDEWVLEGDVRADEEIRADHVAPQERPEEPLRSTGTAGTGLGSTIRVHQLKPRMQNLGIAPSLQQRARVGDVIWSHEVIRVQKVHVAAESPSNPEVPRGASFAVGLGEATQACIGDRTQDLARIVRASIVHDNHLDVRVRLIQSGADCAGYALGPVERRDDEGDQRCHRLIIQPIQPISGQITEACSGEPLTHLWPQREPVNIEFRMFRFGLPWTLPYFPNHLFYLLCAAFRPGVICDVGSRDGAASLRFRKVSRSSRIIAFEANPSNYARMRDNQALIHSNVTVEQMAVSDRVGRVSFYALEDDGPGDWKGAAGSLYERTDGLRTGKIEVESTTLDRYLLEDHPVARNSDVALWLDVEGAAYKVIAGANQVLQSTKFIQVEVERRQLWQGQKCGDELDELLRSKGFVPFAQPSGSADQVDVLYVSQTLWRSNRVKLMALLGAAVAFQPLRKVVPIRQPA
jgi:FkbM family methyltransferase